MQKTRNHGSVVNRQDRREASSRWAAAFVFALTLGSFAIDGGLAMAQDGGTPDVGATPTLTPEQQALADEKARAEAKKAVEEAKKAAAEAELAAMKAKLGGIPDSGITGDVKAGAKAGQFEADLLANKAIQAGATRIATDIAAKVAGKKIYVYPENKLPDLRKVAIVYAQKHLLEQTRKAIILAIDEFLNPPAGQTSEESLLGLGLTLDSIGKLVGFFRSDFSIENVEISVDSMTLVQAVAGSVKTGAGAATAVYVPSLYDALAPRRADEIGVSLLANIFTGRNEVSAAADKLTKEIAVREEKLKDEKIKPGDKKAIETWLVDAKDLLKRAQLVVQAYDALRDRLQGTDDAASSLLGDLIVWDQLKASDCVMLLLSVKKVGGTSYTQKNLWTAFGRLPFSVAGGAVVSYTLFNGPDGSVLGSAMVPLHGGYRRIHEVEESVTPP